MATSPYVIQISPKAAIQIKALPLKQRKFIIKVIEALGINPRPPGATKIEGMTGLYSESVHHLRLIYKIDEQEVLVLLVK